MAYKVELSAGTAVVDLAGGVHYRVLPNGVLHGPPTARRVFGGGASADGERLIEERFGNREVVVRLQIVGASKDDLIAAVRKVQDLLDRARERETTGFGSPVQADAAVGRGGERLRPAGAERAAGASGDVVVADVSGTEHAD